MGCLTQWTTVYEDHFENLCDQYMKTFSGCVSLPATLSGCVPLPATLSGRVPYLPLPVGVSPYLPLSVGVSPYLPLSVGVSPYLPLLGVSHDNFATLRIILGNPHCCYILRTLGGRRKGGGEEERGRGEGRGGEGRGECNNTSVVGNVNTHITKFSTAERKVWSR